MSTLTVCDWCHQAMTPRDPTAGMLVISIGGDHHLSRNFHRPSLRTDSGRDCFGEWLAMVELAEQHREVVDALT